MDRARWRLKWRQRGEEKERERENERDGEKATQEREREKREGWMNRDSVEECATAGVCERQKEQEGMIRRGKEKVREFDERK